MDDCVERICVYVSAKNLPNMDLTSKTDPFCVVDIKTAGNLPNVPPMERVGISEVIMDTLNPQFAFAFEMNYHFEMSQEVVVSLYDKDSGAPLSRTSSHTPIGTYTFNLATLMNKSASTMSGPLVSRRAGSATVSVRGEALSNTRDCLTVSFSGKKLANKDGFFGRSDPFLVISRVNEDGSFQIVFKNKPIMNNLSPNWPPCVISIAKLCNGDMARPLKIEIYDFDNDGSHDLMGTVTTSVDGIMKSNGTAWDVTEIKRGKTVKSGQLFAHMPKLEHFPSFVEFINGGMEVSLALAIDFTASNGDPMDARSLHYVGSGSPNGYQQAIQHVGSIVAEYDSDKMFPVYGFGAKMNGTNVVNHCFPVYGGNGEVSGVDGLQKAYIDALGAIKLSGPTLLSPFLRRCIEAHAPRCTSESQRYSVLMVLADGCICDMDETIDAIVELSYHPVSIIIVGIGNADFSQMRELDGDDKRLSSKLTRKVAARDIVQFVRLNDYGRTGIANLAKDTLHEIPDQVLGFMKNNKINPSPPPPPYFA